MFRSDYDKNILLDEDNYLNYENWPYWDNNIVSEAINELYGLCIDIANKVIYDLINSYDVEYKHVTVSELETNIDFYVGKNNSLKCIENFASWIDSDDGNDFKRDLSEIAMKYRMPYDDKIDKVTNKVKNESVSVQFKIGNGLYFKVYRKDKDHIRTELTFKRNCLKCRFEVKIYEYDHIKRINNRKIVRITKATSEFSKNFFKYANLESVFYDILEGNKKIYDNKLSEIYCFNDIWNPELNNIYDHIIYGDPIRDNETIQFIRRNKSMSGFFYREYDGSRWNYFYDPMKVTKRRIDNFFNSDYRKDLKNDLR